ncbi:MAG: MarR family transcriptional regulator [bacterium]|nr:MarR family transcriptional regulator [bacterium]
MTQPQRPPLIALLFEQQRWIDSKLLAALAEYGWSDLTRAQSLVFGQIDAGCTNASEIAARLNISRQAVNRTVGELVSAGYLKLHDLPGQGNMRRISLTAKGRKIMHDASKIFDQIEAEVEEALGANNFRHLIHLLSQPWG